jgi:hypothetical protein
LDSNQRKRRILELRDYATRNFDDILLLAHREIREKGWVRADKENFKPATYNQPCLTRREMLYRRPWGDFLLILADRAQGDYYVTEATAKSYARAALKPFEEELLGEKWRDPRRPFLYK